MGRSYRYDYAAMSGTRPEKQILEGVFLDRVLFVTARRTKYRGS